MVIQAGPTTSSWLVADCNTGQAHGLTWLLLLLPLLPKTNTKHHFVDAQSPPPIGLSSVSVPLRPKSTEHHFVDAQSPPPIG